MSNGLILDFKRDTIRKALAKTKCQWAAAGRMVGMSPHGVRSFAIREKLVKRGNTPGVREWVLA